MYDPLPASPKYDKKMLDAHSKFRSSYLGEVPAAGRAEGVGAFAL